MRAAIGSQRKLMNRGVTCVLFGSLKINLAAAFWINYILLYESIYQYLSRGVTLGILAKFGMYLNNFLDVHLTILLCF